jgi:hypothetical protein
MSKLYSVAASRKEAYWIKDQWNLKTKERKRKIKNLYRLLKSQM